MLILSSPQLPPASNTYREQENYFLEEEDSPTVLYLPSIAPEVLVLRLNPNLTKYILPKVFDRGFLYVANLPLLNNPSKDRLFFSALETYTFSSYPSDVGINSFWSFNSRLYLFADTELENFKITAEFSLMFNVPSVFNWATTYAIPKGAKITSANNQGLVFLPASSKSPHVFFRSAVKNQEYIILQGDRCCSPRTNTIAQIKGQLPLDFKLLSEPVYFTLQNPASDWNRLHLVEHQGRFYAKSRTKFPTTPGTFFWSQLNKILILL